MKKPFIAISFILLAVLIYLIIEVPPSNFVVIMILIVAISAFLYNTTYIFLPKKYSIIIFISSLIFLTMNYFGGFQILNNILLLSGIMGITLLLRQSKNK